MFICIFPCFPKFAPFAAFVMWFVERNVFRSFWGQPNGAFCGGSISCRWVKLGCKTLALLFAFCFFKMCAPVSALHVLCDPTTEGSLACGDSLQRKKTHIKCF